MVNIRVAYHSVRSNSRIDITFTHNLDTGINSSNIIITSSSGATETLEILSTSISDKVLSIYTRPMRARVQYKIKLASTTSQVFKGARGESFIEDGATNYVYIIGPENTNDIRDSILNDLPEIYDTDSGSLTFDAIDAGAQKILAAEHKIKEIDAAGYISIQVDDEEITRGAGPFDRFANEGVFKLIKVSDSTDWNNNFHFFIY